MIITDVKPIKLQFWPPNPPRDGLAAIPTRDVFLVQIETDAGTYFVDGITGEVSAAA